MRPIKVKPKKQNKKYTKKPQKGDTQGKYKVLMLRSSHKKVIIK
jgi:hypothetical protein